MLTSYCQRWRPGRIPAWRHTSDGGFDPARYGVAPIDDVTAKAFVTCLHYSGTYPAAVYRYGMFDLTNGQQLVGVAVLSVPASRAVLTAVFPRLEPYAESLELGRFVLVDEVPANGESWFLAEVRRLAAASGVSGVVAFSDPLPRTTANGHTVMPGHVGIIYQASNAIYTGRSTPRTITLLPDGSVFSDRAAQKVRAGERGSEYAARQLVRFGARPMRACESSSAWLRQALSDAGGRRVRHPGNHRYALVTALSRPERAAVVIAPEARRYPKVWLP